MTAQSLKELNRHPLNQAALLCLKRAKEIPKGLPPGVIPVLALAITELAAENELDDRLQALNQWAETPESQAEALALLEKVLEASELMQGAPLEAAQEIAEELQPMAGQREVD
jgi:hypothetical protein